VQCNADRLSICGISAAKTKEGRKERTNYEFLAILSNYASFSVGVIDMEIDMEIDIDMDMDIDIDIIYIDW